MFLSSQQNFIFQQKPLFNKKLWNESARNEHLNSKSFFGKTNVTITWYTLSRRIMCFSSRKPLKIWKEKGVYFVFITFLIFEIFCSAESSRSQLLSTTFSQKYEGLYNFWKLFWDKNHLPLSTQCFEKLKNKKQFKIQSLNQLNNFILSQRNFKSHPRILVYDITCV